MMMIQMTVGKAVMSRSPTIDTYLLLLTLVHSYSRGQINTYTHSTIHTLQEENSF